MLSSLLGPVGLWAGSVAAVAQQESSPPLADTWPRDAENLASPQVISSAGNTTCVVTDSSSVVCWGSDAYGIVSGASSVSSVKAVSVGYTSACAITLLDQVVCWGTDTPTSTVPTITEPVVQVALSGVDRSAVCALTQSRNVVCWGTSDFGMSSPPTFISTPLQITGGDLMMCALLTSGGAQCWGFEDWAGRVSGAASVASGAWIDSGRAASCTASTAGALTCWGFADGRWSGATSVTGAVRVSVGQSGCAISGAGRITCFGSYLAAPPTAISQGTHALVEVGDQHGCVVSAAGAVSCWGLNSSGQATPPAGLVVKLNSAPTPTPTPSPSQSSSASASPSSSEGANGWSLLGSLILPTRSGSTLRYSGDVTAPAASSTSDNRALGVRVRSSGVVYFLSPGTNFAAGTTFYEGSLAADALRGAGDLDLVIAQFRSTPGAARIFASGLAENFSLPGITSRSDVTQASSASVVLGDSVTLYAVTKVLWTDGVTTDDTPTGSFRLQFRATGTALWETVASGSASASVTPKNPGDYRFLVGDKTTTSAYVNVVRPTTAFRINDWAGTASAAFAGTTLEFSATVDNQFDDGNWRPAAAGTAFELQFLAEGSGSWQRIVRDTIKAPGTVSIRWPMAGSGRFRLVVSGAISSSLPVELIVPTSVVALDVLDLPSEISPGEPVDISVGVEIQYSDGEFRPAPDGTSFVIEFAASDEPVRSVSRAVPAALLWETVARGKTKSGGVNTSVRPDTSGYWRVSVGRAVTEPVFVAVPGGASAAAPGAVTKVSVSKPRKGKVTVTWSAPSVGKGPFEYQIRTSADGVAWGSWTDLGSRGQAVVVVTGKQAKSYMRIRAINARGTGRELQIAL